MYFGILRKGVRSAHMLAATSLLLILPAPQITARSFSFAQTFQRTARTSSLASRSTFLAMTATTSSSTTVKSLEESSEAYRSLIKQLNTVSQLERASAVLSYDEMVFMPHSPETAKERGLQKAAMAAVIHEKSTDPQIEKWIAQAESDLKEQEDTEAQSVLRLTKKDFVKNARVPGDLVAKAAELASSAYSKWVKARTDNDYESFSPVLQECFDVAMETAKHRRDSEDIASYDEMLDQFEVGMPSTRIDDLFSEVREALVPLIEKVLASSTKPSTDPLHGTFPVEKQKEMNEKIVKALGFDTNHGRIDVSVHPFTTSFSPMDVRITSRFREDEWYQGLAGSVHECGHAIYEQNMGNSGLKVDTALSMGMHESQSLFWERHIGLSKPFWKWACPMINESFDTEHSPEDLYGAVNAVSQSLIRVEADELTYPLHVVLRYGIERDVIEGSLEVKDIPKRWNDDMKSLLNIEVPSDTKGCLQDVHWAGLAFGYFPTYLIGSMTAAQLAHYCKVEFPNLDSMIENGEFKEIKEWLTKIVHVHGSRYESLDEHLEDQLGEKLNPKYFIQYLTEKYSELYAC